MEKVRGNSNVPKRKSLNDRFSAMNLELDDQLLIRRGRYHQSVTPYEENLDFGSPLVRYILGGSPMAGKLASSGEAFTSPTVGSGKYIPSIAQQYSNAGSPLSTLENLEAAPPVYRTPVKVDEEVLVIDDILVRSTPPGGKGGRSSSSGKSRRAREESSNCRHSSQCQFSYANEELHGPTRFSIKIKSEAHEGKSSPVTVPSTSSHTVSQQQVAVASVDRGIATQPASPIEPKLDFSFAHPTTFIDWSPLDDNIECILPHASTDKPPLREEVDAHISKILTGSTSRRRLPVFVEICPDDD